MSETRISSLLGKITVLLVIVLAGSITASAKVIYVDDDASLGGNGQTWATAYKCLQDALSAAMSGVKIRVAQGIYKPDRGGGNVLGNRYATFQLKNGVAIKGGYAGFGQPDPDARDIEVYETVLSGDLIGNDGSGFANNYENSYHVVTGSGTYETAVLDGFTITAGNADENQNVPWGCGGGMYNQYGSPTVTNCNFSRNWSGWDGGGMYNRDSSKPIVTNCTFIGNAAKYGGGMYQRRNSNSTITNCTFSGNSARTDGGGMFNYESSSPILTNCTFIENSAEDTGGGMRNENFSSPVLTDCTFSDNSAGVCGGGMLSNSEISPLLTNCNFINNSSGGFGGGIYNGHSERYDYSELTLMNCTFKGNWAVVNGGAIDNSDNTTSTIVNCIFTGNVAGESGGGISSWVNSRQTLTNCTFSGNSASNGGGMYNNFSSPTVTNCILWGNTAPTGPQIDIYETSWAIISYSDVQGGWPGIGNINADPLFVDPAIGDYHLLPGSPCIDAGNNSAVPPSVVTDLDGNYRIANGRVEMGVYEFGSTPPPSTLFVDPRATGASDGSSWVDAFADLQEALTFAKAVPKVEEILVAQGAYSPEGPLPDIRQASNPNPPDGADVSNLDADLSWTPGIYATSHDVYFGTTSPGIFQCNQIATTFDPGTMAMGTKYYWRIDEVGPSGTTTGAIWSFKTLSPPPPPPLANSNEQAAPAVIDRTATFQLKNGVVIKGGYAGFHEPDPNARDIEAYETILSGDLLGNDEPNFVNYEENSYHVVTGSGCDKTAVLDGFTITAGYANGSGNPDNSGGGMYNTYGSPTLINCTFTKNAASYAGAMANRYYCSPTLINCNFIGNAVTSSGAGMFNWRHSDSTLINCNFSGNFGRYGGAMRIHNSSPTLTNCTFSGNLGRQQGGAIYVSYSSVELSNCSFSSNVTSLYDGGGIYDHQGSSSLFLTNCILFNNIDSGGMDESAQIHGGTPVVNYCCIQGWTGTWPGLGNTGSDPVLVRNPDDGGDGWGVGNRDNFGALLSIGSNDDFGDLHLLMDSPCINTGHPDYIAEPNETDLDGKPRIIGGRIDMGAYEFNHVPVADAGTDRTVEAQAPWGATVTLDGSGSSDADSTPGTIDDINDFNWYQLDPCDPNADVFLGSGEILDCNLSIGEHIILLEVIDKAGASDTNEITIIVQDTTPPDINCPPDVTLECPADTTPSVTGKATATDTCGNVTITHSDQWQQNCGNAGTLARTWTATDECGNSSSCMQIITVVDTTPPGFEFSVAPTMLWPPDHKMVQITPSWTVSDECDAAPQVSLVSIVANEGDDTIGDGHTSNDIQIGEGGSIYLRSERSGTNTDRLYTITYQAVDDCGNTTIRSATVSIPHDFKVLARIAAQWLWAGPGRIPEDLNGDGVVNLKDIAIFANNWIQ